MSDSVQPPDVPLRIPDLATARSLPHSEMPRRKAPTPQGSPELLAERRTQVGGEALEWSLYQFDRPAEAVTVQTPHLQYWAPVSGRVVLRPGEGEPCGLVPGQSVVLPAGHRADLDVPEAAPQTPTRWMALGLPPGAVNQVMTRLREEAVSAPSPTRRPPIDRPLRVSTPAALARTVATIAELFEEGPLHRDLLMDLHGTALVLRLLQSPARALVWPHQDGPAHDRGLPAAVAHVHQHLDTALTVAELAEVACMSESTFRRAFRADTGRTPYQYVTLVRMRRAERLLQDPHRSVTEVSYEVGFRSVSHFIKAFKRHAGTTPKAYQQGVQET